MVEKESNGSRSAKVIQGSLPSRLNTTLGIIRPSRIYIVEHFVALVSLALLLISGIGLFNATVNHFMDDPETANAFGALISFEELALYLALALVALPIFLVFYARTRMAERAYPALLESRGRRRLSYVFLMITSLFLLGFTVAFMYTTVLTLIGGNAGSGGEGWLQAALKQVFAIEFIGLATYFVSRMNSGLPQKGAK